MPRRRKKVYWLEKVSSTFLQKNMIEFKKFDFHWYHLNGTIQLFTAGKVKNIFLKKYSSGMKTYFILYICNISCGEKNLYEQSPM